MKGPSDSLVLWKSDVAEAYQLLPMHSYWQVKQINTIDGVRYVNRNCAFGGQRSRDLYITFMGLLLWIAEQVAGVKEPNAYMDDSFGWDWGSNMVEYSPFQRLMPANQQKLLTLLDNLGVPHKPQKQLHGPILEIIGLLVDAN
jgi:hypothetical protein